MTEEVFEFTVDLLFTVKILIKADGLGRAVELIESGSGSRANVKKLGKMELDQIHVTTIFNSSEKEFYECK